LSRAPLPIGLSGQGPQPRIRTETTPGLNRLPLPVGLAGGTPGRDRTCTPEGPGVSVQCVYRFHHGCVGLPGVEPGWVPYKSTCPTRGQASTDGGIRTHKRLVLSQPGLPISVTSASARYALAGVLGQLRAEARRHPPGRFYRHPEACTEPGNRTPSCLGVNQMPSHLASSAGVPPPGIEPGPTA
jgi:hypothetical protein